MNLFFFQNQFCTRALKQAIALRPHVDRFIGITSSNDLTRKTHREISKNIFDKTFTGIENLNQFRELLKTESPDIVHCHNWPDTQTKIAIQARKGYKYKVVHDVHDHGTLCYDINDLQREEEIFVEKNTDAFIFVSKDSEMYIKKKNKLSQPSTVIYSKPNKKFFPKIEFSTINKSNLSLAYQGGIHNANGHHRNYIEDFKAITKQNIRLNIYTSSIVSYLSKTQRQIYFSYKKINPFLIKVHKALPQQKLYERLTASSAGISTLRGDKPYLNLTIPNKIFEYAICGLPSITDGKSDAIKNHLSEFSMGQTVKTWSDIDVDQLNKSKEQIFKNLNEFSMETEIQKSLTLYKELIDHA